VYKTILGKAGIKATVIADSISEIGIRMISFEIEYPRLVLSELNTHRMLSKNSSSSRAIPFAKMATQLNGIPVSFGANQSGMAAGEEKDTGVLGWPVEYDGNSGSPLWTPEEAWAEAKEHALYFSEMFSDAGYHKQVFNRLTEPFQMMKTVISGTEWDNFDWLRNDDAADPTLHELARCIKEARDGSTPQLLKAGQWHLPYIAVEYCNGEQVFFLDEGRLWENSVSLEEAIKVSCARCAAVSYRNEGYGLEKSVQLYERLVGAEKKHASALEHCATPMQEMTWIINCPESSVTWESGVSHMDRDYQMWSGNLRGFIQYRKLIPGENYER
jgi:hypothetical protein